MNLEEAIERTRPDFVLDVTPPSAHREVALTCFAAGVSVLGEKPLSIKHTDGNIMPNGMPGGGYVFSTVAST